MKQPLIIILTVSALVALIAWKADVYVHEKFSSPWQVKKLHATVALAHSLGEWLEYMGVCTVDDVFRASVKMTLKTIESGVIHDDVYVVDDDVGSVPVRIRIPQKESSDLLPGVIYLHGGAYVVGDRYQHDKVLIQMAKDLRAVVISVTYRLSQEAVWPAQLEDGLTVSRHFLINATDYGIDPQRVAIAGDSAGGHLTASVVQALRDEQFPVKPKAQVLIYMLSQVIDSSYPSHKQNVDAPVVTGKIWKYLVSRLLTGNSSLEEYVDTNTHVSSDLRDRIIGSHEHIPKNFHYPPYSGPTDGNDQDTWERIKHLMLQPYLNPVFHDDLSNLPPAFVFTAQYCILRDHGIIYAKALERSGVEVEHFHHDIAPHAIFGLSFSTSEGRELYDAVIKFLHRELLID